MKWEPHTTYRISSHKKVDRNNPVKNDTCVTNEQVILQGCYGRHETSIWKPLLWTGSINLRLQPITWHLFQNRYFLHDPLSTGLQNLWKPFLEFSRATIRHNLTQLKQQKRRLETDSKPFTTSSISPEVISTIHRVSKLQIKTNSWYPPLKNYINVWLIDIRYLGQWLNKFKTFISYVSGDTQTLSIISMSRLCSRIRFCNVLKTMYFLGSNIFALPLRDQHWLITFLICFHSRKWISVLFPPFPWYDCWNI